MRRTSQLGPFVNDEGQQIPLPDEERDREMIALGWMLDRMGGSIVVGPLRVRSDRGGYVTVGLGWKYDSGSVPAVDAPKPQEEAQPLAHEEQPVPAPSEEAALAEPLPEPALAE